MAESNRPLILSDQNNIIVLTKLYVMNKYV